MGLEIAELMMDIEEHLGIKLEDGPGEEKISPKIKDVTNHIHTSYLKQVPQGNISEDYILGLMMGLIFSRENRRIRGSLTPDTDLVKDLHYG